MPKNYRKFDKAIIIGWNLKEMDFLNQAKLISLNTPYGKVKYFKLKDCIFICRHGIKENVPPHRINYRANISALQKLGVKYIFSFNSVGSLKKEIKIGEFLIPSDYIDFDPPTFYEKRAKFIIPEFSLKLKEELIKILKKLKIKFKNNGVYFQTKGPRLETKAEINLIKNFADIVGMTMAKEATLAKELNLEYISLCSVDNYAQGIIKRPLTQKEIKENQKKSIKEIEKIIKEILTEDLNKNKKRRK
ncbi:MAG: MTAP family purine nucleoside phosphorylase [Patescibacteria group bacterium]|nr:MTAP family purine nucleoside phosphorylase [Patescibacteria group bacterium]